MKQPLAIVGASVRAAAASAARAGFQPIAADLFADLDLRAIATATRVSPYPEGLLDWLRAVEPPAWMYTGALENYPDLVDQMAWIAPLWGNPGDVLTRVRSPWQLAAALRDAGLLFPETRASPDGLPHDGSWLAKTYQSAGGSGVRAWEGERAAWGDENRDSHSVYFQQRVPGFPCAAAFVAADGAATLLGITRQLIGESWLGTTGFRYAGSIGPLPIAKTTQETIARIGQVLTERFELVGLFGIDCILDGDQVWTLEVNPRYTASMEICERVTGILSLGAHASAWFNSSLLNQPVARIVAEIAHGKAILFAKRDVVAAGEFVRTALAETVRSPWPALADLCAAGSLIETGRPILTVFADGETVGDVESRLRERVAGIEKQLFGNDI